MISHLPKVGDSGFYSLEVPFDTLQIQKLTCVKISRLSDLDLDIDVHKAVYEASDLTDEIYEAHVEQDMIIALLSKPDGNEVYIPVSYFKSYVQSNIVPYTVKMVCVNLGPVPDGLGIEHVVEEMRLMAAQLVGTEEQSVSVVEDPVTELITQEDHEQLELVRLSNVNRRVNPYAEKTALEIKLAEREDYIKTLEASIAYLNNQLPPTT